MLKIFKPIIIVMGGPKSIFCEILFKALENKNYKSPLILIGNFQKIQIEIKKLNFKKKIHLIKINDFKNIKVKNKINVINVDLKNSENHKKKLLQLNTYINKCFKIAFNLIKNGCSNKLINGPINKHEFLNKRFLGVTEFISNRFTRKTGMLIYNKNLSVCPVTTHLPISLVAKKITKKLIEEKIEILNNFYKKHLKIKPKIAVVGLNPHCESILKFNEDKRIVSSAIKNKSKKGINVKGPYSADTIFLKANRKKFNVILGMFHDQVLTPIKTLYEFDAINITMGLPFLRITPDHGPNEKMFGKNISNPKSLINALKFLDLR